ncbi:MAG: hypothetical protein ABI378_07620 [Chitinophagaceae bacterium]
MKRFIALFFLTTYLLATTELGQFLKIPAFVSHFQEHKHDNKGLTLLAFIYIHYANEDVNDADYDKDMKLPFKACDNSSLQFSITTLPESIEIPSKKLSYFSPKEKYFVPSQDFTAAFHSLIWQPPRAC